MEKVPVCVWGMHRTAMTIAVVRALHARLQHEQYEPYWIFGCDGCRPGHSEAIANSAGEIGIREFTMVETNAKTHSYGKIINLCLEESFKVNSFCLFVENDWLFTKDIDLDYYSNVMKNNPVAQLSFKWTTAYSGFTYHMCRLDGWGLDIMPPVGKDLGNALRNCPGNEFVWGEPINANCPVDMGVCFFSKRLFEKIGWMAEGCGSQQSEDDMFRRYNSRIAGKGLSRRYLKLYDANFFDIHENGHRLPMAHVGWKSQHGWSYSVPPQYRYLSDEDEDARICANFSKTRLADDVGILTATHDKCLFVDCLHKSFIKATGGKWEVPFVVMNNGAELHNPPCHGFTEIDNRGSKLTPLTSASLGEISDRHCASIDYALWEVWLRSTGKTWCILCDDDVLFKPAFAELMAETPNYDALGAIEVDAFGHYERIKPYLCIINVRKMIARGIHYFDQSRSIVNIPRHDTGSAFLEKIRADKWTIRQVDIGEYCLHLGHGSWGNADWKGWLRSNVELHGANMI